MYPPINIPKDAKEVMEEINSKKNKPVVDETPSLERAEMISEDPDQLAKIDFTKNRISKLKSQLDSEYEILKNSLQRDISEVNDILNTKGLQPFIRLNSADITAILKAFYSQEQEYIEIQLTPANTLYTYKNINNTDNSNQNS
jgi:uncharacterized protein (UPF0147 family)